MVADSGKSVGARSDQPFARPPSDTPLVVFTDPGLDDALAICWLLARDPSRDVLLAPVAGNQTVELCLRNAACLITALGRTDVRLIDTSGIAQRCQPLPEIHGDDAIGGLASSDWSNGVVEASPLALPQTFAAISLGPCTVPAGCVREAQPIVQMGGLRTAEPNLGDGEFNFELDSAAAFELLSRASVAVAPLDVTSLMTIDRRRLRSLEAVKSVYGHVFATAASRLLAIAEEQGSAEAPAPDLTAVVAWAMPEWFEWEGARPAEDNPSRFRRDPQGSTRVAAGLSVDPDDVWDLILEGLSAQD